MAMVFGASANLVQALSCLSMAVFSDDHTAGW
jgi:hypothetical protein